MTNCTPIGKIIGSVGAKDDDSSLNGNNYLIYSGSSASFVVLSFGSVMYTSQLSVGDVDTGSAYVTDMGLHPGPLQGTPTVVSVTCDVSVLLVFFGGGGGGGDVGGGGVSVSRLLLLLLMLRLSFVLLLLLVLSLLLFLMMLELL